VRLNISCCPSWLSTTAQGEGVPATYIYADDILPSRTLRPALIQGQLGSSIALLLKVSRDAPTPRWSSSRIPEADKSEHVISHEGCIEGLLVTLSGSVPEEGSHWSGLFLEECHRRRHWRCSLGRCKGTFQCRYPARWLVLYLQVIVFRRIFLGECRGILRRKTRSCLSSDSSCIELRGVPSLF